MVSLPGGGGVVPGGKNVTEWGSGPVIVHDTVVPASTVIDCGRYASTATVVSAGSLSPARRLISPAWPDEGQHDHERPSAPR